ncbi:MAG TPA: penicillin-binding transpeptidase domain-containing protein, partial [Patescibacteria group bacterium]|nr:penicillin-binding transpeptidase domain-containing protein [Patescibacteria group bacterium]
MNKDPFHPYAARRSIKDSLIENNLRRCEIDSAPPNQWSKHHKLGIPASQFQTRLLLYIAGILFCIILGQMFRLQIIRGAIFRERAEGNRIQTHIVKALRGIMYDSSGNALVKNIPNFTLVVNAADMPDRSLQAQEKIATQITELTQGNYQNILDTIRTSIQTGQSTIIQNHIAYNDALPWMIATKKIAGVHIEVRYGREYLAPDSYAHILGYTSKMTAEEYEKFKEHQYLLNDDIGKNGLEKYYESSLRGKDGYQNIEVDFRGQQQSIISDIKPSEGDNLHLTIDSVLQEYLYQNLQQIVQEKNAPGASAVAIDPRNGNILALISYPSYNNNTFAQGISQEEYDTLQNDPQHPLFFRAISGQYPSGSVFKPIVAAAALEEKVITENTTVGSTGGIDINGTFFPDWKKYGHGSTNVYKALAESVNTFFYLAGGGDNETSIGLGVDRIYAYADLFGLGKETHIDLPHEASGFLPSKAWKEEFKNEEWYIGDTYHLAIGQGDLLVTPLQVASYT